MPPARHNIRGDMDSDVRLTLLEGDADSIENEMRGLRSSINKLTWAVVGVGLTIAGSGIMLALNLVANAPK